MKERQILMSGIYKAPHDWASNPWVWALSFEVLR